MQHLALSSLAFRNVKPRISQAHPITNNMLFAHYYNLAHQSSLMLISLGEMISFRSHFPIAENVGTIKEKKNKKR